DEIIYNEQDIPLNYTFPKRDYVNVDENIVKKFMNNHVLHTEIVKKLGDTTLTIMSTVYDGNAAIMEFKLERKGGVNAFKYSRLDNEYHGAAFTQDVAFWFHFPKCSENIIVDLERSTDEVLYCYDYMALDASLYNKKPESLTLEVCEYPCTRGDLFSADEKTFNQYKKNTKTSNIKVPLNSPIKTTDYKNADGGIISISPIAMKIDMDTGLRLSNNGEYDTDKIYNVEINYKAEKNYKVLEHSLKGIHSCETKIDNTSAIDCNSKGYAVILFNRLVDTDKIDTITVNNTIYKLP
ncbi:MAG: hypothetical protein NC489_44880, partial [Ruminococcus flavefaciens]|nr:hypothetical protein [Ruminococcus flavefaciens]